MEELVKKKSGKPQKRKEKREKNKSKARRQ